MTFEEWWTFHKHLCQEITNYISIKNAVMLAWKAATSAERQRCREIVDERGRYGDIAGMLEQIGE